MWTMKRTGKWDKDVKHFDKKHSDELAAVSRNLKRFEEALAVAPNSKAVQAGYLHPEPMGVLAIDQKGGGANLRETRLYVYVDDEKKIIYAICLGDKDSQSADIAFCKNFVKSLGNSSEE